MKIAICGKGGAGKSTISALISRGLTEAGFRVLLMDADESNFGLHRLLGVEQPVNLMESMGGKPELKKKMNQAFRENQSVQYLSKALTTSDIPEECFAESDGVKLVSMGKIHDFGEGCACPIGVLSRNFLNNLVLSDDEVVVIDTEAGVEHFGRGLDANCDLIIGVVDPTFESFKLAGKMLEMSDKAFKKIFFIRNKVSDKVREAFSAALPADKIAGEIPQDEDLFLNSLNGTKMSSAPPQVRDICAFIKEHWVKPAPKSAVSPLKL
ncbi:P-loop NTPase [Desulfatibacillum aliphaticivorans]|uniref:ATP-binding protein n=1 Tax=Desulfatibacillum aliphaticivorans TaxID=218208 RepID=UPI000423B9F0|nr:P-loop NTPase [Desulfatibacillum aliphaticivorans]